MAIPREGEVLPIGYASFLAVKANDVSTARRLLLAARSEAARQGLGFLCLCLHERDPLASCLRGLPAIASHGRLYEVTRGEPIDWGVQAPIVEAVSL